MARKQNPTNTISNRDWNSLVRRARKAHPYMDDFADPRAIKRRKQSAKQFKNANWN